MSKTLFYGKRNIFKNAAWDNILALISPAILVKNRSSCAHQTRNFLNFSKLAQLQHLNANHPFLGHPVCDPKTGSKLVLSQKYTLATHLRQLFVKWKNSMVWCFVHEIQMFQNRFMPQTSNLYTQNYKFKVLTMQDFKKIVKPESEVPKSKVSKSIPKGLGL